MSDSSDPRTFCIPPSDLYTSSILNKYMKTPEHPQETTPTEAPYHQGMKVRRQILGDAHVDRSIARTSDVNRDFQDWIVRCGWGEIWTRPGLAHRDRRILVIGTMIALGRWDELRLHLRAAIQSQMPLAEIQEIILQQAMYCGIPAANSAHQHLAEIIHEIDSLAVAAHGVDPVREQFDGSGGA